MRRFGCKNTDSFLVRLSCRRGKGPGLGKLVSLGMIELKKVENIGERITTSWQNDCPLKLILVLFVALRSYDHLNGDHDDRIYEMSFMRCCNLYLHLYRSLGSFPSCIS